MFRHAPTLVSLVSLALFSTTMAAENFQHYIQIGGLLTLSDLGGPRAGYFTTALTEGEALHRGWSIWQEEVNSHGGIVIGNQTYGVNVTEFDVGGHYAVTLNRTLEIVRAHDDTIDFYFGPFASEPTLAASIAIRDFDKILITGLAGGQSTFICPSETSPGCTKKGARISPNTFASTPTGENYLGFAMNLLVVEGARTLAIYSTPGGLQSSALTSILNAASDYGLQIVMNKTIPTDANDTLLHDLVGELASLNADIVFGNSFIDHSTAIVREMKNQNYTPRSAVMRLWNQAIPEDMQDLVKYFIDVQTFDDRLRGTDYVSDMYFQEFPGQPAPKILSNLVHAKFPEVGKMLTDAIAFLQGEILHRALLAAESTTPADIRAAIPVLVFNSVCGRIAFSTFGLNEKTPLVTLQMDKDRELQILSPSGAATAKLIYPMPTWDERVQSLVAYRKSSEMAILVVNLVLMAGLLGTAIFVAVHWNNVVIRAASPPFLMLILLGAAMVLVGILMWPLQTNSAVMCHAVPWLLVCGFVLLYGSIFARTYRLMRIFTNQSIQVFKIPDTHLFLLLGLMMSIAVILLTLWQSVDPVVMVLVTKDPNRPSLDFQQCQIGNSGVIFVGLLLAYLFVIIIIGGVIAVRIWNIRFEVYNESKQLGFAIYNLLFFIVLAILVSSVFDADQLEVGYILRSVCLDLAVTVTVGALFIPKVVMMKRSGLLKSWGAALTPSVSTTHPVSKSTGTNKTNSGKYSTQAQDQAYICRLKLKIKKLRAEIAQLKDEAVPDSSASSSGSGSSSD